ncbi:MAG: lysophospholipid acyltransferase family protein [Candidatus Cloacimonadales bacterium]
MSKNKQRTNKIEAAGMKFGLFLLKIMSPKSVKALLNFVAINIGYRIGIRKKLVIKQMKRALPHLSHKEILDYTKRMYQHYGLLIYETFKCDREELVNGITIEGAEHLEEAKALGKSVLVATGHYGNWEVLGYFLLRQGIKLSAIAKKQSNPHFEEFLLNFRKGTGLDVIYQKQALRGILAAIKNRRMILFIHDQDARKTGEIMPFLNHDASVFMGVARIALKADLAIMPAYHIRTKEGKHVFRFEKIFYPKQENLTDFDVMQRLNTSLEDMIKEHPELWFWVHRRWKSVEKQLAIRN